MNLSNFHITHIGIAFSLVLTGKTLSADEVTRWNEVATTAAFESGLAGNPIFESRVYAMAQAAVHDALNRIDRRYSPYVPGRPVTPESSPEAAVATAAHDVLLDQFNQLVAYGFPSQQAAIGAAYTASLAVIPDSPAKTKGIIVGMAAASALLELRASDGWNKQTVQDFSYPQGTHPGEYRFTPGSDFAFLPRWGDIPPFVLKKVNASGPILRSVSIASATHRISTK